MQSSSASVSVPASTSAVRAEAFSLPAALDAYELTCSRLVTGWLDMGQFADAGHAIAAIRQYGVSNPSLTVLALQLAIAHAELESVLWEKSALGGSEAKLLAVRERHAIAVQALRMAAALPRVG
jgi:hypothetical protein